MNDVEVLRTAVRSLVGQSLRQTARVGGMQMFLFGPDAEVTTASRGTFRRPRYAAHLQCPWRLLRNGRIYVASSDAEDEPANPEEPWEYRSARLAAELPTDGSLIVVDGKLLRSCDVEITISDGSRLQAFVDSSKADDEAYRLVDVLGDHVIVRGGPQVLVVPRP